MPEALPVDLTSADLEVVRHILAERVPDCEVRAYGSRVKRTAWRYSDLDLVVVGESPLDWRVLASLREAFSESSLPVMVDVLDWHAIPEAFREEIAENHAVVQEGTSRSLGD